MAAGQLRVAGPKWIDTTVANKGIGVQSICRVLGIDPADVMAFGDNYNDVAMLDLVGHPYIMSTAAAELRRRYANHTPRPRIPCVLPGQAGKLKLSESTILLKTFC